MYLRTSEGSRQEFIPTDTLSSSYIGEPKLSTKVECSGYTKGEIEKSTTQKGHLPFDVIQHPRGLLIADFGVGWSGIKKSTKKEKLLQDWLGTAKSDPHSIVLRIYGYSDCVGKEKNNVDLRRSRANRVYALLDKNLQSRVDLIAPARVEEYIIDNSTVENRATNRGAIIELLRLPSETIEINAQAPSNKISKGRTLTGVTVDYYNVRETPNGKILGTMTGTFTPVTVEDKTHVDGIRWYQVVLKASMKLREGIELSEGLRCWINEKGVEITADWGLFKSQLREFEDANKGLSLNDRITKLRQMAHPSNLPFDNILGTLKGNSYLEDHPFIKDDWQIMKDYQKVRMPDGRNVDIYHLFVGLDVLTKKRASISFATISLGPNYSAATWAGDIGAGAADATTSKMKDIFRDEWAKLNPQATDNERLEHYYNTRAPESDLIGNIDAWGINALRTQPLNTVAQLLTAYYEETYDGSDRVLTTRRKDAIEKFLIQYGFKYREKLHLSQWPFALVTQQRAAVRRAEFNVEYQIKQFALIWMLRKIWSKVPNYKGIKPDNYFVSEMTVKFLQWLEYQAIENGVVV